MTDPEPTEGSAPISSSVPPSGPARLPAIPPIDKSVAAALVLTFFFGPLGLFYIGARDAIITIIVAIVVGILTLGIALLLVWPITMVWAAVAAGKKHQEFEAWKIEKLAGGANYGRF